MMIIILILLFTHTITTTTTNTTGEVRVVLVGNKTDLRDERIAKANAASSSGSGGDDDNTTSSSSSSSIDDITKAEDLETKANKVKQIAEEFSIPYLIKYKKYIL